MIVARNIVAENGEKPRNSCNLCSPYVYVGALLTVYAFAFMPNKIGWGEDIDFDSSYNFLIFSYVIAFAFGHLFSLFFRSDALRWQNYPTSDRDVSSVTARLLAIYVLSILFLSFVIFKLGTFALVADDPLIRSTGSRLGGYIDYQAKLIMPLALVSFYQFLRTSKYVFLIPVGLSITLEILQLERLLALNIFFGCSIIFLFRRQMRIGNFLTMGVSSLFSLYVLIGILQIIRHGAEKISSTISIVELPLWLIHGALTSATRFGYFITDLLGPGALGGRYTFAIFLSVIIPNYSDHGAHYLQLRFTEAVTAQSIAAPFSYYVDGGLVLVIAIGFVQGLIAFVLWRKAKESQSSYFIIIYALYFMEMLWSIRAGSVAVSPWIILQVCALTFVLAPIPQSVIAAYSFDSLKAVFLMSLVVSIFFLAMRV